MRILQRIHHPAASYTRPVSRLQASFSALFRTLGGAGCSWVRPGTGAATVAVLSMALCVLASFFGSFRVSRQSGLSKHGGQADPRGDLPGIVLHGVPALEARVMAMGKGEKRHLALVVLGSLGWPLIWGSAASATFFGLIHAGIIRDELVIRYFAGHPVEYVETAMFFVGLAALALRGVDVLRQFGSLQQGQLLGEASVGRPLDNAPRMLAALDELSGGLRRSHLVRRCATRWITWSARARPTAWMRS